MLCMHDDFMLVQDRLCMHAGKQCMMACLIKECYRYVGNVVQIKFETIHPP